MSTADDNRVALEWEILDHYGREGGYFFWIDYTLKKRCLNCTGGPYPTKAEARSALRKLAKRVGLRLKDG